MKCAKPVNIFGICVRNSNRAQTAACMASHTKKKRQIKLIVNIFVYTEKQ
jgi:hypothetical protein